MDVGALIAMGAIAVLTTAGQLLFPRREKRIRRQLNAYPGTLVLSANGAIRVTGRLRGDGERLQAPLSGRPCVAYELVVDGWVRLGGGPDSTVRRRFVDLRDARPFLVTDESGTARIDTSGSFRLALRPDFAGRTRGAYPGKHHALSLLLESRGIVATGWLGRWKPFDYAEGVLAEDQLVSVGGPSDREVDPTGERSGPRAPPVRLVLRGTEGQPLLIDGDIGPKD
jgi:hypothetical protein